MTQTVGKIAEQGASAYDAAVAILSQFPKSEVAEREVLSIAYQIKAAKSRPTRVRPASTSFPAR